MDGRTSRYKEASIYFAQYPANLLQQNLKTKIGQEAADQYFLVHGMDMWRSVLKSIRNFSSHTTLHVAARNYIHPLSVKF
jgi:hypothetical protein